MKDLHYPQVLVKQSLQHFVKTNKFFPCDTNLWVKHYNRCHFNNMSEALKIHSCPVQLSEWMKQASTVQVNLNLKSKQIITNTNAQEEAATPLAEEF